MTTPSIHHPPAEAAERGPTAARTARSVGCGNEPARPAPTGFPPVLAVAGPCVIMACAYRFGHRFDGKAAGAADLESAARARLSILPLPRSPARCAGRAGGLLQARSR